jgi:hypothetical protein
MQMVGRNDPCPCGSGNKFKRCHGGKSREEAASSQQGQAPSAANLKPVEIRITLKSSFGAPEEDGSPDNPLARATKNLLTKGQRLDRVALAALQVNSTDVRWIGMFVKSSAGRLIFFPGFAAPYDRLARNEGPNRPIDISFAVDHITLENNLKSWHFTEPAETGRHAQGGRALDVGDGRVLWFGMTINGPDDLRVVRSVTVARGKYPPNDQEARARMSCFMEAVREGQAMHVQLPSKPHPGCVLHFAVIAAKHGAPAYQGPNFALTEPYVSLGAGGSHPGNTSRLALSPDRDIQIIAFWVPGPILDFDGLRISAPT